MLQSRHLTQEEGRMELVELEAKEKETRRLLKREPLKKINRSARRTFRPRKELTMEREPSKEEEIKPHKN